MVLENSSDPPISIDSSAPPSDNDPYNSPSADTIGSYHIDTSKYPKPLPFFGPLTGFNDQLLGKVLQTKLAKYQQDLKRPITQDEANAIGYHTAKQISIGSYATPIGTFGGAWRAYSTMGTFRFPFYSPNLEKFDPNVFPSSRYPYVVGGRAGLAWHALRLFCYGYMGKLVGQALIMPYSVTVTMVGQLSDPRLRNFMSEIQQNLRQKQGQLPNPTTKQPGFGQNVDTNAQNDSHDASPTAAYYEDNGKDSYSNTVQNGQWAGSESPPPPAKSGQWPKRPAPVQSQTQEESNQPFDAFDDASPTGGQGVAADTTAPQAQRTGSAWERIRRGEGPTKQEPPSTRNDSWSKMRKEVQSEQHQGSTTGDSFAFSKSEEERALAKEEAQKEFDARVERERRGGNFTKGGGDQKRW